MIIKNVVGAACACMLIAVTGAANAALISRLGGLAYYDNVLDVTWIADANLAASNSFGLPYNTHLGYHPDEQPLLYYQNTILDDGRMTWGGALHWLDAMNASNGGSGYLGFNDWRMPTMIDNGNDGCNFAYSGTDCGYNMQTGNAATTVYSEMASLWYDTLGNPARYDVSGNIYLPSWGVKNTGPFSNVHSTVSSTTTSTYWLGMEYPPEIVLQWSFATFSGHQGSGYKSSYFYSWAVRSGDVSAVPVPAAAWLFGSGLLGLVGIAKRKRVA